jgi:SWI/SNF-related matrix-associated actin-dependent regulator 1 of chromatin subfamily A
MQAEDRCHRIGQKDSVSCYYLLLADTVEVNIAIKLENKLAVIEAAISGCDLDEVGFLKEMFDD